MQCPACTIVIGWRVLTPLVQRVLYSTPISCNHVAGEKGPFLQSCAGDVALCQCNPNNEEGHTMPFCGRALTNSLGNVVRLDRPRVLFDRQCSDFKVRTIMVRM